MNIANSRAKRFATFSGSVLSRTFPRPILRCKYQTDYNLMIRLRKCPKIRELSTALLIIEWFAKVLEIHPESIFYTRKIEAHVWLTNIETFKIRHDYRVPMMYHSHFLKGKQWTTDLKPLRTCWVKEYLTVAPYLLLVFKQQYSYTDDGKKKLHYYHDVSINLASGILLSAIHVSDLIVV